MKFALATTFFGAHSFGGDAAYVDHLARALARRGHEVHVFHCADAFDAVRGRHPLRPYTPPEGVHIHTLRSPVGRLSPVATQATGLPLFKASALREVLDDPSTDVVHFHNISLIGGPGLLHMGRQAVRLMTAHEHWLICPMHLLWKYGKRPCDAPDCLRCTLHGRRPPQLWRYGPSIPRGLQQLDALIFPSRHTLDLHRHRGLGAPMVHLPYFLPDDWSGGIEDQEPEPSPRPFLAAAGRLVAMKGFQRLIPLMRLLPEADLRIAGTGPYEAQLRGLARDLPNVHFEGLLSSEQLARLFHRARAVVVPSLFPETFGYVVAEAFAVGTPVVVHRGGGAIQETGEASGGGLGYSSDAELLLALRRMIHDHRLRDELANRGAAVRRSDWTEAAHLDRYFELIGSIARARRSVTPHSPLAVAGPGRASASPPRR